MTSIYISEINLYIKESTLSIIFFVFSLILYGFINITTCTENLLIKVILIHLPILLLFLLKLLSTHFIIGISILFLSISIWLIYIFVYLKLNRNKNIQINSLFMKSLLILVLVLLLVFPSSLFSSTSSKELRNSFEDNKPLIQQNKNELNILDYKKWYKSSEIEKLHCLQIIVNIESNISGISDIPKVKSVDLHKTIKGRFINQNNIIQINKQYLNKEDCNEIVSTVLHEFRHKYQFKIIESCDFEKKT